MNAAEGPTTRSRSCRRSIAGRLGRALVCALPLAMASGLLAADGDSAGAVSPGTRFKDPVDGWFDASAYLDSADGFVPVVAPITEPSVGHGAAGPLVFIDR